jgi:iron complex transport system permease protein
VTKKTVFYIILFIFIAAGAVFFVLYQSGPAFDTILPIRLNLLAQYFFIAMILSFSGMILQTLLANPLAEPYILGVSGGSGLGSVAAVFFSVAPVILFRTVFAAAGGVAVGLLILLFSGRRNNFSIGVAVLAGVGFNSFASAGIVLLQNLMRPNDFRASISWLLGNIDYITAPELAVLGAGALPPLLFLLVYGKELDIYLSGDEMATAVGVDTGRLKIIGFIAVSLSAAIGVSIAGMIGFIGLIVPHIVKMLLRPTHRGSVLPLALTGFGILLIAGILSKTLVPGTILPLGAMTSLIGAPFFVYLLVTRYPRA